VKVEKIIPILKPLVENLVEGVSINSIKRLKWSYLSEELKELVEEYGCSAHQKVDHLYHSFPYHYVCLEQA
jgi:hypothetical protein